MELQSATRRFFRRTTLTALGVALLSTSCFGTAQARHHHHPHRGRAMLAARVFGHMQPRHVRPGGYAPPFSVLAVDGNSGRVLYGRDENAVRHPASVTKVMTLYMLFGDLERGRLTLDTRIPVSAHAASMAPTKLGLRPGSTIRVEDAILSMVTKSANDMAVAVAEAVGGDEETFAKMMTRKAHSMGMSRSNFVNASGLPDDMQLTTAHDLVILGRAIHDRYPRYFRFFSTPSFRYAGQYMPNHNHLMEQVEGMDGIKTGYTRMSGFNLLSSVSRNGHWMVGVVLGGKTRLGRDRIMADLIESQIDHCSTVRTAPMVAENPALEHVAEAIPVVEHVGQDAPPVEGVDDEATVAKPRSAQVAAAEDDGPAVTEASGAPEAEEAPAPVEPPAPRVRPTPAPIKVASLESDVAQPQPQPRPRPAFVSGVAHQPERDMTATGSIPPRGVRLDGLTSRYVGAATATPSTLKHQPHRDRADTKEPARLVKVASLDPQAGAPSGRPAMARGGWMIQIGATPTLDKANDLIARAKGQSHGALGGARPFTEKVQKGKETLFRARFAGLDAGSAEAACRNLKRAGVSCFATKN